MGNHQPPDYGPTVSANTNPSDGSHCSANTNQIHNALGVMKYSTRGKDSATVYADFTSNVTPIEHSIVSYLYGKKE